MAIIHKKLQINSKHYLKIFEMICAAGGNARLVGGAVRDALLGIKNSDIDIATDLLPEQIITQCHSHGIKIIPTGIKFGTVTAIIGQEQFEITTLRKDLSCDGRHANVMYSRDFAEDAIRRDFTINALSYCPFKKKIYDYFGGIDDLNNKRVKFIGRAEDRIEEDYLRILRFFRFSCRFAKQIDAQGLAAAISMRCGISRLSLERIKSEMDLLIVLPESLDYLELIVQNKILDNIWPVNSLKQLVFSKAQEFALSMKIKIERTTLYALLFRAVDDLSIHRLLDIKFSRKEAQTICEMHSLDLDDYSYALTDKWLNDSDFAQYFIYIAANSNFNQSIANLFVKLSDQIKPIFPINGNDLLALGYKGAELGVKLAELKKRWIVNEFNDTKEQLLTIYSRLS
jgi:poly(A) polymerase